MALWADGIIGVDPGRRPGADDWLLLAVGDSRLIPIRTHPARIPDRLGLIVHADEPPTSRALAMLVQFAAGDAECLASADEPVENRRWALDTIVRVASAL